MRIMQGFVGWQTKGYREYYWILSLIILFFTCPTPTPNLGPPTCQLMNEKITRSKKLTLSNGDRLTNLARYRCALSSNLVIIYHIIINLIKYHKFFSYKSFGKTVCNSLFSWEIFKLNKSIFNLFALILSLNIDIITLIITLIILCGILNKYNSFLIMIINHYSIYYFG